MSRVGIISIDGHVKASRAKYRDYITAKHVGDFDDWVQAEVEAGARTDAGNVSVRFEPDSQWDSANRIAALEADGVFAEVLFPNGQPFQVNRLDDFARSVSPELANEGRQSYNRWLADFCAEAPGRRSGQMVASWHDIDQAVADVYWAKEHGLGGISVPAIGPGGGGGVQEGRDLSTAYSPYFLFDPILDPIWAACQETDLTLSQHGGSGLPDYTPRGFAALMMLRIENAYYSNRAVWQMIVGGVFDRFPDLRLACIETQVFMLMPALEQLEHTLKTVGDSWMEYAKSMNRERSVKGLPSEYFSRNCFIGVSPFPGGIKMDDLLGRGDDGEPLDGFHIGADAAMFGADYPHTESTLPSTFQMVNTLLDFPSTTAEDAHKILYRNAAEVYGFDMDVLQPFIDEAGFELDEVPELAAATAGLSGQAGIR